MSERPFMQLYVSDFVASTLSLSAEGMGAYALLLFAARQTGGALPNDPTKLARMARISVRRWAGVWSDIQQYFMVADNTVTPWQLGKWDRDFRRLNGRAPIDPSLRQAILERDGERCSYCGTTEGPFHIDHVHPVALGGTDDPDNLTVACKSCNLSKGSKPLEVWLQ